MLSYIKKRIGEMEQERNAVVNNGVNDDSLIVECAHLFQELSDLTVGGTGSDLERPTEIDIPVEDDIEIESIELNMFDGRVTDVPMDASVQESTYTTMKEFSEFYQEALTSTQPFMRETDSAFRQRCDKIARAKYAEYKSYLVQEGLFGFGMININDNRVPATVMCDFGPISPDNNNSYFVKLDVFFQTDGKRRIMKKQLDSINKFRDDPGKFSTFATVVKSFLMDKYAGAMKDVKNLWDVVTPKKIVVPVDPIDKFIIAVAFEVDFIDELLYFVWSAPIKANSSYSKTPDISVASNKIDSNKGSVISKKEYMKESHVVRMPSRFGNIYQEAIDFGDGVDNATATPTDEPPAPADAPASDNQSLDAAPSVDMGDDTAPAEDATPVDTNNVSDQIAEKVAATDTDATGEPTSDDSSLDIPIDDSTSTDDVTPVGDIDQQLNDLNDAGNGGDTTDLSLDDVSTDVDVENMTIDELLAQGSDKLKGMTIQQLKNFLSSTDPDTTLQESFVDAGLVQEAFFLNKKNINKEIDVHLRKSLGILNDNELEINDLITAFKKEGKTLNKVLSKASKMKKVYSDEERDTIAKLNKCLCDLMMTLKSSNDNSYVATIKRLIQAFTSQAAAVAKIVEGKSDSKPNTDVSGD